MSSAANHRKRSHRSETMKSGTFAASQRRAYYTPTYQKKNGVFARMIAAMRRKAPEAPKRKEGGANDNV